MLDNAVYELFANIGRFFLADFMGVDPATVGFFMFAVFVGLTAAYMLGAFMKGANRRV